MSFRFSEFSFLPIILMFERYLLGKATTKGRHVTGEY